MTLQYPERLHLAQLPTPISELTRLNATLPGRNRVWVKRDDLTGCAASGNKIRKLEFTLAEAKRQGADVIITCGGVQSNHARATAVLGAQLGLKVHLILRGEEEELTQTGNHFLDLLCGAQIDCYPSAKFVSQFDSLLTELEEDYKKKGLKTFFIPIGASDGTGTWGYVAASEEISLQCQQEKLGFDHIVCAAGSGGTLAGLTAGADLFQLGAKVWGINVCDTAEYFRQKSRQDLRDWQQKFNVDIDLDALQIHVIDGYVGPGYARAEQPVFDTIAKMATLEGIILDQIYTAKAFHGLLEELEKQTFGTGQNILFIHTGGLFGLLADQKNSSHLF